MRQHLIGYVKTTCVFSVVKQLVCNEHVRKTFAQISR